MKNLNSVQKTKTTSGFHLFLILIVLSLTLTPSLYAQKEVTDSTWEFELNGTDKLVVLDFYATWCGPCKRMHPILEQLAQEYGSAVKFLQMDVDQNQLDDELGIDSMPTFVFWKDGKVLDLQKGATDIDSFRALIEKNK